MEVEMVNRLRRFARNRVGAALVEYTLIVAGVALIGAAAVSIFGNKVTDMLATAAAILPGAHAESNAPIVSGKIIETSPNAAGFDDGNSATGIGLDVNAITQANGQKRLGDNVGGDGSLSSLVLETKNR
jgi:pilus assembly protein Flp/PilA